MRNKISEYVRRERATIITQTPMRVTLGGGGTDSIWYSKLKGGAWISAAIDKYVFIFLNKTEDPNLIKASHGIEATMTDDFRKIPNSIIRECLKLTGVRSGIEISTAADASPGSGLGGSGAFEVGLINAVYTYKRNPVSQLRLAEEAAFIEMKRLRKPVGPQDQYIAALGGIKYFEMDRGGRISIESLNLSMNTIANLESNLLFFRTGIQRNASDVLSDVKSRLSTPKYSARIIGFLDEIKKLGQTAKIYLLKGKTDDFGKTLDIHWQLKRKLSSKVSNQKIDEWYTEGIRAGAIGGKLIGAGGGGWFMFYVRSNQSKFRNRMEKLGLTEKRIRFDWEGSKVLVNLS